MTLPSGTRVRVAIPPHLRPRYGQHVAASLDGMTGVVERDEPVLGSLLVLFDRPARTWWRSQQPPQHFWFNLEELEIL